MQKDNLHTWMQLFGYQLKGFQNSGFIASDIGAFLFFNHKTSAIKQSDWWSLTNNRQPGLVKTATY